MKEHPTVPLPEEAVTLPENSIWRKLPLIAGVVGVISLIASFGTALYMKMPFFAGYLIAFLYFLSIALGGMFAVLIHFATRAGWSVVIRRLAEFILGTFAAPLGKIRFPLFLILFIPIVIIVSVWKLQACQWILKGTTNFSAFRSITKRRSEEGPRSPILAYTLGWSLHE